jgi:hypothetical protein
MEGPRTHRPQAQSTCERAPGRFHTWPLLIPHGEGGRDEPLVVAMVPNLPVAPGCRPRRLGVQPPQAPSGQPQSTTVAAARPQRTHPRGMRFLRDRVAGGQGGREVPPMRTDRVPIEPTLLLETTDNRPAIVTHALEQGFRGIPGIKEPRCRATTQAMAGVAEPPQGQCRL